MGINTKFNGYEPFQYLDIGLDFDDFDFPDRMNSVGKPYEVPLTDEEEEIYQTTSEKSIIFSAHEHPFKFVPSNPEQIFEYSRQGRGFTAYEYLANSNLDAAFDFHFDGFTRMHSNSGWKFSETVYDLGMRACDIDHQAFVIRGKSVEDILEAHHKGKIVLIPAMESAVMIENELNRLEVLFGLGVRMMGITYSQSNDLGQGLADMYPYDGGLTNFGEAAVKRMNKIGMAISVSHASDQTALDVCEATNKPVFYTHDGARKVLSSPRLKSDECLLAVAETGGVIAVQSAPNQTASIDNPKQSIESVMDHFEYIVNLVGIDHVAFGPDSMYGDHRAIHKMLDAGVPDEANPVEYAKGMENPTEAWHNIVRWLVKHGYSERDREKVLGENLIRALDETWP